MSVDDVGTAAVAGAPSNSQQSLASMGSLQQQPLQGSNGSLLPALSIFRADSAGSSQQSGRQQSLFSPGGKLSAEAVQQLQRAVFQLQQELAAAVQERDAAQEQLYQALRQADEAAAALQKADKLRQELQELEGKVGDGVMGHDLTTFTHTLSLLFITIICFNWCFLITDWRSDLFD